MRKRGYFGKYGGQFVPELLMPALIELEAAYRELGQKSEFQQELTRLQQEYAGRPTPVTFADRLTSYLNGAKIYFKREDLNHTGSHKLNNCLGQVLLAR
ncbi:tryptophan synthase subunit beta, partial [bacterium]|nr:tryptophan synthase subunit beta [bacterium]